MAPPAASVDSWATVAIPTDPADANEPAAAALPSTARTATALAEVEPPSAASPAGMPAIAPLDEGIPDDADAPPEDDEPPFDPGPEPEPEAVVEASVPVRPMRSKARDAMPQAANEGGIQRYGEAVVREVLGATFLEEVEAPGRPGFGERG